MKVFFYNPSTKTSIWERPHELKNRPDVDKMLKAPASSDEKGGETPGNKSDESDIVSHDDQKRSLEPSHEESHPVKKTK